MRRRLSLTASLGLFLTLGATPTAARPVSVEVITAQGATLGRLTGELEDRVTYFQLDEVARLTGGTTRRLGGGVRALLVVRRKRVELRRDQPNVRINAQPLTLTAPVRVRQGTWLVPADLLVRVVPALIGAGIRVVVVHAPPPPGGPGTRTVATVSARVAAAPPPGSLAHALAPEMRGAAGPPSLAAGSLRSALTAGMVDLRYRSYPGYTRIVLEGEHPTEPRLVDQGEALLVSLAGWSPPGARTVRMVRDGLIAGLELTEARGAAALRVTFERPPAARKVHRLVDPPRLLLDFYRAPVAEPARHPPTPTEPYTIVLDPGHGGHDPGAVGPGGLQEKDLTLDVARRVAALLQDELAVRVVLTRTRDQFVALRERTGLANREKADLFLSIHLNAAPAMTAAGTEAYFLSSEASDNAARAAAAFENRVIALEAASRGGSRDVLRTILWDLTQSDFQQEASRFAEALQNTLDRALRVPSRGVKQAPFYVLGGAAMPAVLVEIGFVTNPQEEQRLRDDGYRDRIARALAAGVATYKRSHDQRRGVLARR